MGPLRVLATSSRALCLPDHAGTLYMDQHGMAVIKELAELLLLVLLSQEDYQR